jgi:hypothetical protein
MVPDSVRGIGQDSWWDNNWGLVGAAAVGGLGALAASGAAGAAGTGAAASGDTASLSDASLTSAASQLPQGATTLSDIGAPSFSTAGDSGITASQALQYARYGNTANSLAGNPLGLPGSGGNNMSVSSPAGGSNSPYNMGSLFNSNGGLNYGTALQGAGTAIGALLGNNANQATAGTLQGMYTNAANQAAPSVQAVNNTIQNPNTFFNSPYYKSLSSLYGNNVNATNNAAGNNGNNVTDQQKMMAFGNQQYDSYLNTIGGQAQGFLSNQAKYAPYNATGASLGNNSQSSMYGNLGNMLATGFGSALNSGSLSNLVTPQNSMFADSGALTGGEVDQMGLSSGTLGNQISQNAYDTSALSNTSYLDNLFGNG